MYTAELGGKVRLLGAKKWVECTLKYCNTGTYSRFQ